MRRVLRARGVCDEASLDLQIGRLQPPAGLSGVRPAAGILADAVVGGDSILIVGDFDADGATGTALAVRALRLMGAARVDFRVPNRFDFGYGLSPGLVETLAGEPPAVLVTVDAGICSNEGVERARQLGCKVVVTDHHLPGERLPEAHAIVNPNCPGDPFPSKALAGVGVVFYLMSVVREALRARDWFAYPRQEPNLARLLDLVALGTVADLVPLDDNNRILVRQGMERIRRGQCCAGVLALLRQGKRDYRHLVESDLAFAVAPRLNAAGRMEDMSIGIRCLLTDDHETARELASELDGINHQRRRRQAQMQAQAMAQVEHLLAGLRGTELPAGLCLFDAGWHQGIVGLVASRVKDAVHRPVLAFAPASEESGALKGSARSVEGLHIRDVLARVAARHPGMISAFGGHAMAAGLTLPADQLGAFRRALCESVESYTRGRTLHADILTDGELDPQDVGLPLAELLRSFGPWGQDFPEPVFEGNFVVVDHRLVGGAHLKLRLRPAGGEETVDAIAFGRSPEDLPGSGVARLVFKLDVNHFRGSKTCQLLVEHILPPG